MLVEIGVSAGAAVFPSIGFCFEQGPAGQDRRGRNDGGHQPSWAPEAKKVPLAADEELWNRWPV
jgi:hypothetical protein